jgi:hypothetical protein
MNRLPLALALALALAGAPTLAPAQTVHTSHGLRSLPRTDGFRSAAQYQQVQRLAEDILVEQLADIDAIERARGSATAQASVLTDEARRANREYELAKASFDVIDKKYLADLAAFQQSQVALQGEIERQRAEAAKLEALPSAQRDWAQVTRLNDWATQIATRRTQIEAERTRLLADHANVESERTKLEQKRRDSESKLLGKRDATVGALGHAGGQRLAAYGDLRVTVNYLRQVREEMAKLSTRTVPHSIPLDQAELKLRAFDAEPRARR